MKREEYLEKAMKNAKASMEVEGFSFTKEDDDLIKKALKGEMSQEEFIKVAIERAKNV